MRTSIIKKISGVALFLAFLAMSSLPAMAADGSGTMVASPTTVAACSTGNTITYTFTAAETMDSGEITLTVPSGWSAPQGTAGTAGYTTISTTGTTAKQLDNTDATTGWSAGTACLGGFSEDTTNKHEGTGSIKCINSNDKVHDVWYKNITAQDWSGYTTVGFFIYSNAPINNGDLKFDYSTSANIANPVESLSLGKSILANTWTYVPFNFAALPSTRTAIVSFGLDIANASAMKNSTVNVDDFLLGPSTTPNAFNGNTIDIRALTLAAGQTVTITYGSGGGTSGATAPCTPGTYTFTTQTRSSDSGTLTNIALQPTVTINNLGPTTTSISPTTKTAGQAQFTLTVNGTNFVAGSTVQLDGSNRTTTFVSTTQVTATIPATDIASVGTHTITVVNPAPGGGTSNGQTLTVVAAPSVTNVTSSLADGSYTTGQTVPVQVTFSRPVTVVGIPQITLSTGSPATTAVSYSSGSGTSTLTFNYVVASGNTTADLDYASTSALALNSGTITDTTTGANATLTLAAPAAAGSLGGNKNIVIDTTAPTVSNVTSSTANGSYTTGTVIPIQVVFSEPVTVTGTPQITLSTGFPATTAINYTSGSGTNTLTFNYTVASGNFTSDLDYASTSALALNGGTIKDAAGNNATLTLAAPAAAGSIGANKNIIIDTTSPSVSSITSSLANGSYTVGQVVPVQVVFNENVVVTGTPQFAIGTGTPATTTLNYTSGSGTNTLTFNYTVIAGNSSSGDFSGHLDETGTGSLTLNGGTIKDVAGNAAVLNVPSPGTVWSLSVTKAIIIDTTAPTLAQVTAVPSPTNNTTPSYTFSSTEAGTITYGGSCSSATTAAASGNNTVTFNALTAGTYSNCTIKVTDAAGNQSTALAVNTFTIDTTAPVVAQVTAVPSPTNNTTPSYTFSTTKAGTITYGGSCSSATTSAASGNNTVTFSALAAGTYSNCTIKVTDAAGNQSNVLAVNTFTIDTTAPTVTQVTAVPSPTNSTTPSYTFNTTEAGTITYGGSCSSATTSAVSGNNTITFNALAAGTYSNCTIRVTDAAGNISTILTVNTFTIDTTAPTVSSVTSSAANGSYTTGAVIPIQVVFSEAVNVTGTPQITLSTGTPATTAINYTSGSGTNTLTFNYTVAAGNATADLDYASTTALALNSGTIKDLAGNNATLTLVAPAAAGSLGANKDIVIDTTAPTVTQVTAVPSPTNSTTPSYTFNTTEGGTITYGGSCSSATTTATSGNNTITFNALAAGTYSNCTITVTDAAGNISSVLTVNTFTIDTTAPTVSNVTSSTANGTYTTGAVIPIQVVFSEAVNVTGTPQITLSTGTPATTAINYASGSGTNTLTFNYTVAAGNASPDLDYSATTALALNGGTIKDLAGNNATLTLAAPAAAGSLGGNKNIVIDTTAPTVTQVTAVPSPTNSTTPSYTFNTTEGGTITYGGSCSSATTTATSGNNTITFNVLAAGTYFNCTITVTDSAGNVSSVLTVNTFTIDTTAPTVTSVTSSTANGTYTTGAVIPIQVVFSEAVNVTGTPQITLSTGTPATTAINYAFGSGTNTLTFNYTVAAGNNTADLDYASTTALALNLGTIKDLAGNNAVLTLASPAAAGSLGANKNIVIDTIAPTVTQVTAVPSPTNNTTPSYTFNTTEAGTITYGGSCSSATTAATAGNNTITFSALVAGTYSNCTITVTDSVGNVSSVLHVNTFVIDTIAPTVTQVTAVPSPTNSTTPSYTFNTTEGGTITYGGSCSSATTTATSGNNTITFNALVAGTYSNCTITVTDAAGNPSAPLSVNTFTIDTTAPTVTQVTAVPSPTNSTTPSYTFNTTEAGTITYGGSCSSATTSATSGNNTITFNALVAGTYSNCTITVTDAAGNTSSVLHVNTFVIDTTAPTLAQVTAVPSPTNSTTPSYTFSTTEAGVITYGGSCASATTAATVGNNTITFNALVAGTYSDCTITVTDAAGNTSSVLHVNTFTIDTTAPVLAQVTVVPSPTNNTAPSYTFSSTKAGTITYGGACSSATTAATAGNNTITFNALVAGTYSNCTVKVTDGAGNQSNVLAVNTFVIDTTAPVLAQVTAVPTPSNNTTPSYTFSTTEAGTITYGGSCSSATTTATVGNNTITFNALVAGTYSNCTIKVTDAAGNQSTALAVNTFVIDTTAPVLAQVTAVPSPTNNTTPSYTFSSTKAGTITYGGSCSSATTAATAGSNTVTFTALVAGTYSNCTIKVTDAVGNQSNVLAVNAFTIDTTAPVIAQVTAVPSPSNNTTPSYTFSTTKAGTITYGGSCSSATTSAAVGNNTVTFNALVAGTYSNCTVKVTDAAGNQSNVLAVNTFVIDTTAPVLAQVTAVPSPTNNTTPSYTFSTTEGGTITYGGSCSSATTTATSGNNTITFNSLVAGTYSNCTITVTDTAGNASTPLAVNTFTINTTAPIIAQVTAVPSPTNDTTPSYTFSSTAAGTITYGGSCSSATTSATVGNNTVTFLTLASGTYSDCTIKVTDLSNNQSNVLAVNAFTIDTVAPTVANVTSSAANGSYTAAAVIPVQVVFSEAVNVTGTPKLTLSTGAPATTAISYSSGSGTNTLTFTYTVAAGNFSADLDYAATTSLALNGGTIKDAAGNNAVLTLASPAAAGSLGANKNIVIDTTAPTVTQVTAVPSPTNITTPSYTFNTTEAGTITYGGSCSSATSAATSGNNTVTFATLAEGTYSDCTITVTDAAGNTSSVLHVNTFTIDTTAPAATSVTSSVANGTYTTAAVIPIQVSFSEAVTVTGTPKLTLSTGSPATTAISYASGSGTTTLTFTYTVAAGNASADLDYAATTSLALNGGTIKDAAGNNATLTLASPGAAGSLGANKDIVIDTTAPVVAEVTPVPTPGHNTTPSYTFSSTKAGTITYGGSCSSATTAATAGNNTVTFSALTAGTYSNCTITVTDGNSTLSNVLHVTTFVIDTTAPTLAQVTAVPSPSNNTTPSYTFSTTEAGTITYGGDCSSTTTAAATGNNTVTFAALSEGVHSNCTITVTDAAGNTSSVLHVNTFTIDTTAPVVAEVTPVPTPGHDTTPSYTFSSTEAGTITYGGSCSSATSSATSGNNTVTFTTLAAGTYSNCTVRVTDASGNHSNVLAVSTFVIDTTAPVLAEVTPVSSPTSDTTPDYTFSTTEAGTITYGGSCSSATTAATSGNNTITFNALVAGTYSNCTVTVTDAAGNVSAALSVSPFTIDTSVPALVQVTPVSTPGTNTTPNYVFSSTKAGTITYGGDCASATTSATVGNNTITFNALAVGTHSNCTITVTDALSHASAPLSVSAFTITIPVTKFIIMPSADGVVGTNVQITVQAQAANSAVVTTYAGTVTLAKTNSASIVGGNPVVNIVNGVGTVNITDNVAETTALSLVDSASTGFDVSSTQNVVFTAGALHHFVFATIPAQVAGVAFSATITAKDQFGNTVTSFTGTTGLSTTAGSISPNVTAAYVAGVATPSVTITTIGTNVTITATKTGGSENGTSNPFNITAGATASYILDNPGDMATGTRIGYTVTRKDGFGNLATSGAETVSLYTTSGASSKFYDDANNGNIITSVVIPDGQSSAQFWYYDDNVGTWTITASDNSSAPDGATGIIDGTDSVLVSATPFVATHLKILPLTNSVVGTVVGAVIRAVDDNDNLDTTFARTNNTIVVHSTGSATPHAGLSVNLTNGTGTLNFTDNVAETVTLSLVDTTSSSLDVSSTQDVTFSPGILHHFVFNTIPSQIAGVPFGITITAKDQFGNTVTSFGGTADLSASAGTVSPNITASFVSGIALPNVSVTASGAAITLTATKTGGSENGTSNAFTVASGSTATYILDNPGDMSAGTRIEYTVTRKDGFGNLSTGAAETVYLYTSSDASSKFYDAASAGNVITSVVIPSGQSSAHFWYFDDNVGTWTVTASDNPSAPDGTSGIVDGTDQVSVSASAITAVKLTISAVTSALTGSNTDVIIKAADTIGNTDVTFTGDVTLTATGATQFVGNHHIAHLVNGIGQLQITDNTAEDVILGLSDTASTGLDVSATRDIAFVSALSTPPGLPSGGGGPSGPAPSAAPAATSISFSGQAFPTGQLNVFSIGVANVPIKQQSIKQQQGRFALNVSTAPSDTTRYGLMVVDKNGNISQVKVFTKDAAANVLQANNLVMSPTIDTLRDTLFRGDFLIISGYSAPENTVEFDIDGKPLDIKVHAAASGLYKVSYSTIGLDFGYHTIRARQTTPAGIHSDYSVSHVFNLTNYLVSNLDMNADGIVDAKDASVFFTLWYDKNANERSRIDLNGDGKVDVQDLSIFLRGMKKTTAK